MSTTTVQSDGAVQPGRILLTELNALLRLAGARRPAEALVSLLGVIGLQVLAVEGRR